MKVDWSIVSFFAFIAIVGSASAIAGAMSDHAKARIEIARIQAGCK